jgi:hypothetical protein
LAGLSVDHELGASFTTLVAGKVFAGDIDNYVTFMLSYNGMTNVLTVLTRPIAGNLANDCLGRAREITVDYS